MSESRYHIGDSQDAAGGQMWDNRDNKTAPTENVCRVSTGASPTLIRSAN